MNDNHSRIALTDALKTYTYDQDKMLDPLETIQRVKARFDKANLDVLKETVRIDRGRLDIPVFISVCGGEALRTIGTKKQMGKGVTSAQAEASALMELVERYSFFHFLGEHPLIVAEYRSVSRDAMPFHHIAEAVHHDPNDLERAIKALDGLPLKWAWGRNLTQGQDMLVPIDWFYEINQFNGPSAGNSLEEAVLQGTCEVVERHVSALICRGKLELPSIESGSVKNEAALELIRKYRANGIELFMKDFTLEMGIPSIGALAWDPSTFPARSEIVFTAGTATDPEKALIRALTEIAQLAGDFDTDGEYIASGLPKPNRLDDVLYMTRDKGSTVSIDQLPNIADQNMRHEVERCVEALSGKGFELYVVNTTHPDIDIPAVYTIVPGCHFRERSKGTSVPFFAAKLIHQNLDAWEALKRLQSLNRLYPDTYYLQYYEGVCYAGMGDQDAAISRFLRALELEPSPEDAPTIQCYLGICHKDMGDYARAIQELEKATQLDPECKEAFNAMGFCYFKLKEHEKAIECFENVLLIDPGSAIDYANIASNLRELGRIDEAVRLYGMALELDAGIDFARQNLEQLVQRRAQMESNGNS